MDSNGSPWKRDKKAKPFPAASNREELYPDNSNRGELRRQPLKDSSIFPFNYQCTLLKQTQLPNDSLQIPTRCSNTNYDDEIYESEKLENGQFTPEIHKPFSLNGLKIIGEV